MKNNPLIGVRLKYCRERNNKTLEDIGRMLGVHKSTVSRWEKGETDKVNLMMIATLSNYYGVSEAWLSGKDVPMEMENETKDKEFPITENNPTENDEVEEEYLLASRSKDGKRGIEVLTKTEYETAKALIQTLRKNTNDDL